PWLSVREAFVGIAPVVVMSVSFSGELAYEIHVPNAHLYAAYLALRKAGEGQGMQLFGARAVDSMRLEKGYLHWKAEILTEFDPFEAGLDRFVRMEKANFVGKAALKSRLNAGPNKKLVTLAIQSKQVPAHSGASVMQNEKVVGTVMSGGWGHRIDRNLAMAFVDPDTANVGTHLDLDLIGMRIPAEVIESGPFDPSNARPKT
ncbi:MAG: glycine cleavage T C-terminal barrel domain-containing protein, partial [Paracoccaceae bacterium]